MKVKSQKNHNSTQDLIGIRNFSRNGLLTGRGELVYFIVRPTNISVLSQSSIALKVRHLMQLLTAQPDIDIVCMDDCENFDANKDYLKRRLDEESNPKVRALLQQDALFLDQIQVSMSTARRFMFVIRLRNETEEQSFANLNRIEKSISEQGFDVKRASKGEIKRFLALYFSRASYDEELPDFDGENALRSAGENPYAPEDIPPMPEPEPPDSDPAAEEPDGTPVKWIIPD